MDKLFDIFDGFVSRLSVPRATVAENGNNSVEKFNFVLMPEKYYRKNLKPFGGERVNDYLGKFTQQYHSEIERENENYLLNVNETNYLEHISTRYKIDGLELHFNDVNVDTYEANITQEFVDRFDAYMTESFITRDIIQYFIPYSGDINLIEKRPNHVGFDRRNAMFDLQENCLVIEFINLYNNGDDISNTYNVIVKDLSNCLKRLNDEIETYNLSITGYARHLIKNRKEKF